jgi:hypothetical protein
MGKQDLTDRTKEWLKQAHYDLETAVAMQAAGNPAEKSKSFRVADQAGK